jgi:hypothetical protein
MGRQMAEIKTGGDKEPRKNERRKKHLARKFRNENNLSTAVKI